jgi:hypothetical protein
MGAKTALLAYTNGSIAQVLRADAVARLGDTVALVTGLFPGWTVEPTDRSSLSEAVYPPDGIAYAGAFPGVDVICDRRFALAAPSQLPQRLIAAGRSRRLILHAMHSVSDWFAFAVWDNGELIRSLSLDPGGGVGEDVGERFPFEAPFWAGEHPVHRTPGWPNQEPYPLPFHPLDLGEAALRELCGFVLEGSPNPNDIDADAVGLYGFRLQDPSAPDPAVEHARMQQRVKRMKRRSFTYGPDGALVEIAVEDRGQPNAG